MDHNKGDRQMEQLREKAEQQLHHAEQALKTAGHDFQEKTKAAGENLKAASHETGQQLKAAGEQLKTASHELQEKTGQQLKAAGEQLKTASHDFQEKAGQQLKRAGEQLKKAGQQLKEAEKPLKGSMKRFLNDFKAFALKGNVMDLAIGVMIGGAFQSIVTALTENLINPLIGLLFQMNLDGVGLTVYFGEKTVFFGFGAFVSAVINFVIMAFVLFCLLKLVHRMMDLSKKEAEPAAPAAPAAPTQEELLAAILQELKTQNQLMTEDPAD